MGIDHLLSDVDDILPEVPVFRKGRGHLHGFVLAHGHVLGGLLGAQQPLAASLYRLRQDAHLPSGIIKVILARDVVSGPIQEIGDGIPQHGVAAVTDR